jgi:6-pyruvoyltetrahydropterin/6-carboxytetrahydropterin synthase
MYTVTKRLEISAAHQLSLNYESKCKNLHGHNWIIYVTCQSETLDANGMVVDFKHIKNIGSDVLDHQYLNDVLRCNPTAENIARWICEKVPHCVKVSVQESEGNVAVYEI